MHLQLGDWLLDVDVSSTMERTGRHADDHCECGYCRNFYLTVDKAYPNIRPFFAQFGVNIEGPDEFCPYEPTICEASYIICGKIVRHGTQQIHVDGIPVLISSELDLDHVPPQPSFGMTVGLLELPWVLEEPMEDVISPANDPACLERMWKKLLSRSESFSES